uniref:hypothetical protein n=1 Tax=Bacillus velezensis TaxID=492670 RepID=UPI001643AC56
VDCWRNGEKTDELMVFVKWDLEGEIREKEREKEGNDGGEYRVRNIVEGNDVYNEIWDDKWKNEWESGE